MVNFDYKSVILNCLFDHLQPIALVMMMAKYCNTNVATDHDDDDDRMTVEGLMMIYI